MLISCWWDRLWWQFGLAVLTFLAAWWVAVARGAEVDNGAAYRFNPGNADEVRGFFEWQGFIALSDEDVVGYFVSQGADEARVRAGLAEAPLRCAPGTLLGFFQHPTLPGIKVLCNPPAYVPTEAEMERMCQAWGLEFGGWFPGSPERQPEVECRRPPKVEPSRYRPVADEPPLIPPEEARVVGPGLLESTRMLIRDSTRTMRGNGRRAARRAAARPV